MVPDDRREPHVVFAVECAPGALAGDPSGAPLLFQTEAQAFAYRRRLGILHPVLVFYEDGYAPDVEAYDTEIHTLTEHARINAYVDGWEEGK